MNMYKKQANMRSHKPKDVILLILALLAAVSVALNMQSSAEAAPSTFPKGVDTFKIAIDYNVEGIVELTYEELQAAGMNVANVNPNTFAMRHRGNVVSYELVGNGNSTFEPGESVRFYAERSMTRHEYIYTDHEYYWIWANGTSSPITTVASQAGCTPVDTFRSTAHWEKFDRFQQTKSPCK